MNILDAIKTGLSSRPELVSFCLVMSFFFMPISTSGMNIFVSLSLAFILLTPSYWGPLREALMRKETILACVFFFYIVLACLWSPAAPHNQWVVVGKYSKLLYLPFLTVGFLDKKTRKRAVFAFLAAMVLTSCVAWLKKYSVISLHIEDTGYIFRNHIITGYMMSVAAYVALLRCAESKGRRYAMGYASLFILFSYHVLFIGTGRMAYLIYFLLIVIFLIQKVSLRHLLMSMIGLLAVVAAVYQVSPVMQSRIDDFKKDYVLLQQDDKSTSMGYRLQFHQFAFELFKKTPWLGQGTSGFSDAFEKANPVPSWGPRLFEPHSQYWLIAADGGMVGLALFFALFISFMLACLRSKEQAALGCALLISFLCSSLTDSFLLYSMTGMFLILFLGLCLAGCVREPLPTGRVISLSRRMIHRLFRHEPRVA